MTARNSKGVTIEIVKSGATGTPITPTGASKADPAVVTTAATSNMVTGDLLKFESDSTGLPTLDGKYWVAGTVNADTDFEVLGADTTNDGGTFAAGSDITLFGPADMVVLCLSAFDISPESPTTISVGTFCDPTATLPGATTGAGTVSIAGYIDIADPGYLEILDWDESGGERQFRITLPGNGYLVFTGTLANVNYDLPIDGAMGWNAEIALSSKIRHVF